MDGSSNAFSVVLPILGAALLGGLAVAFSWFPRRTVPLERTLAVGTYLLLAVGFLVTAFLPGRDLGVALLDQSRIGFWMPLGAAMGMVALGVTVGTRLAWAALGSIALVAAIDALAFGSSHLDLRQVAEMLVANGLTIAVVGALTRQVVDQEERASLLESEANTDTLTGLPNRRSGEWALERAVHRAHELGRPLSVILFDLDHFKILNDAFGHDVGDRALKDVKRLFVERLREGDVLARWGGEEFLLIVPGMDIEASDRVAERLRASMEEHPFLPEMTLTASFGVAQLRSGESVVSLVKRADEAMYAAKRDGRNVVRLADGPHAFI
jgi:diguanylate cyclase (GGDEF)-like protein